ncbi:hypothetical protein BCV69DRAFT_314602 [Microstroma glucosiphilum]|uniref:Uncharacterized protein n=1 Tax=Pseudomicrostroma glucosiphilum TaxID=1684307 RepID=A0A316U1P0_9BASI|nr:hypothetical protein BCV69DRAFT_314602 [Pseudomicrostroma glucosiphilum]PWN18401.1 hypothetical protein BCV69DRAFT_314602 [Pseudomicrostroma glucosiphilum]
MSTASPDGAPQSANDVSEVAPAAAVSEEHPLSAVSQKPDLSNEAESEASPSAVLQAEEVKVGQDTSHATSQSETSAAAETSNLPLETAIIASDQLTSASLAPISAPEGQRSTEVLDAAAAIPALAVEPQEASDAQSSTPTIETDVSQSVPNQAEVADTKSDAVVSETESRLGAASPSTTSTGTAAAQSAPLAPVPVKKFTSLNVNKIFLEKASPTPAHNVAAVSPAAPKALPNGGVGQSNRFASSSSAASRLTSAKLSAAGKPAQPSWASTAPVSATSPGPGATSAASPSLGQAASSTAVAGNGAGGSSVASGVTPRLSTSLSSSANNRSSSPRLTLSGTESGGTTATNRGSPSLRNATLGSLNRSGSPATSTGSGSGGSTLAPWANLKAGTASSSTSKFGGSGKSPYANPDFPTAAEAAAVKKAQEEKEKAEAAEAAARHEQHLRSLDRFRGQALGSGKHWDEMEDEDGGFLDEVVQFADGTQYKVQASKKESEGIADGNMAAAQQTGSPVTKEERFKDVDHDRSWPLRGGPASLQPPTQSAPTVSPSQPLARRTTTRETLDITSGAASISLDAQHAYDPRGGLGGSRTDRGWGARGGRGDRDEAGYGGSASRGTKAGPDPTTSAVRAWGPLAVRQQSLNPEAARAQAAAAAAAPPSVTSPVAAPAASAANPRSPVAPPAMASPNMARREPQADPALAKAATPSASHAGRALPPHLALRQGQMQSQQPQVHANRSISATLDEQKSPQATGLESRPLQQQVTNAPPWQTQASAGRTPAQSEPSPAASSSTTHPVDSTADDRGEMLSAAERARRRRQEEEEQRAAQRERAKQKALAIEEKMRKEAEQKAAEAEQKRLQEEAERERQRAKKQEEEDKRRAEAERKQRLEAEQAAAVAKRADNIWRPRDSRSTEAAPLANGRAVYHGQEVQPPQSQTSPVLSPSDGATSWRRQAPTTPAAPSLHRGQSRQQEPSSPTSAVTSPQRLLLKRPSASAASSAEGMANLDDVMGRIRGAMQQQQEQQPRLQAQGSSVPADKVSGQVAALVSPPIAKAMPTTPSIVRPPHLLVNQERIAAAAAAAAAAVKSQQEPAGQSEQKPARQAGSRLAQNEGPRPPPSAPQPDRQVVRPAAPPKSVLPEPFVTKIEPPAEQAPVWNKFKVSLKTSTAVTKKGTAHISNAQFKAEKARRSMFAQTDPAAPAILTWEPAIPGLSIRTLSRDDQFFPKKYKKGTVITGVVLPNKRLSAAPLAVLSVPRHSAGIAAASDIPAASGAAKVPVAVKLPGSAKAVPSVASTMVPTDTPSVPSIPTEPASMRAKNLGTSAIGSGMMQDGFAGPKISQSMGGHAPGSFDYLSSSAHSGLDVASSMLSAAPSRSPLQRGRGSGEGVAFAQSLGGGWNASLLAGDDAGGVGSAGSASPVSFMVHSELDSSTGLATNPTAIPGLTDALPSSDAFLSSAAAKSLSTGAPSATAPVFHSTKPSISHLSSASTPHTTTHTPLLPPASGLGSATWGQGPLTFLEATPNARGSSLHANTASGDQGRIKDMWARSDGYEYGYGPSAGAAGNTSLSIGAGGSTHNSLRDIGDDFLPSTLRMSLNDFSDGAATATPGGGGSASAPSGSPNLMRSPAHNRFGGNASHHQQQRGLPAHLQQHQGGSHQQSASSYGAGSYLDSSSAGTGSGYQSRGRGGHQSAFQYGHQPGAVFSTSLGPVETASSSAALGTSNFDPTVDAFTSSTTKTPYGSWAAPTSSASTPTGGSGAYEGYVSSNSSSAFGRGGPYRSYQPQTTSSSNASSSFGNAASTRGGAVSGQGMGQGHTQPSPFASRGPAPHMLLQQQQQQQQQRQQGEESSHAYGGAGGASGGRLGYGGRGGGGAAGGAGNVTGGSGSGNGTGTSGNVDSTAALWQ